MTLREEYEILKNACPYTPAIERRLDEIEKTLRNIKHVSIRRHRLAYRGTYEETLGTHWHEYKLTAADEVRINKQNKACRN